MEVIFSLFIVFMVLVQNAQENKILTASHGCSCIAGNLFIVILSTWKWRCLAEAVWIF